MSQPEFISFLEEGSRHDYSFIWNFQKARVDQIARSEAREAFIFCEHEKILTTGRRFHSENILDASLPRYDIERGGDVTLHAPGQLVIYPLLKLNGGIFHKGLHDYLRFCEQLVINVLQKLSLDAGRYGPTGVWIQKAKETKKIASIGVAVRRWITYHGIAVNVFNDLKDFQSIRPCDFDASVMTSLKAEGVEISLVELAELMKVEVLKLLD